MARVARESIEMMKANDPSLAVVSLVEVVLPEVYRGVELEPARQVASARWAEWVVVVVQRTVEVVEVVVDSIQAPGLESASRG